jgi:hypothetical protein
MPEYLEIAFWVWMALQIPVALVLAKVLRRHSDGYPAAGTTKGETSQAA